MMSEVNRLSILQYNVMKSRTKVMAPLLRDKKMGEFDIIAVQEPWVNPVNHTTHHPLKRHF